MPLLELRSGLLDQTLNPRRSTPSSRRRKPHQSLASTQAMRGHRYHIKQQNTSQVSSIISSVLLHSQRIFQTAKTLLSQERKKRALCYTHHHHRASKIHKKRTPHPPYLLADANAPPYPLASLPPLPVFAAFPSSFSSFVPKIPSGRVLQSRLPPPCFAPSDSHFHSPISAEKRPPSHVSDTPMYFTTTRL